MKFFEFTFTPNKHDHPVKGAPSVTGYVQAETPELAKSESRRQLREELDPENCMCYRSVRLKEITLEDWQCARSGLSPESVDNCTDSLGAFTAKPEMAARSAVVKKQPKKTVHPPDMMIPVLGSIEAGADYAGPASIAVLNQRLAALRCGESLVIHDLSWNTWNACDGYSASQILLVQSGGLAALGWYKNAPRDMQPGAISLSAAVRAAILEPVRFAADYATADGKRLSDDDYLQVRLMHDSALANPVLSALLQRGVASLSIFYRTRGGVLLKVRPDWIGELDGVAYILNVKIIDDSCDFGELVERRGYHIRAAFYNFVVGKVFGIEPGFAFCTVSCREQYGRHLVEVRSLDYEDVLEGGVAANEIISALESMQRGNTPVGMGVVRRPFWAKLADKHRNRVDKSHEGAD